MEFFIGVLIVSLVFVGGFAAVKYEKNRVSRIWRNFADDRGFAFMTPGVFDELEMGGTERGVSVRLYTETRKERDDYSTYTVCAAELPDGVPEDLYAENQAMLSRRSGELESSDIRADDSTVDHEFYFDGDRPDVIERFLRVEGVADAFRRLAASARPVRIEEDASSGSSKSGDGWSDEEFVVEW